MKPEDPPDDELVKEIFAHFGLSMYLAQVFETGLISILTAIETAASKEPTPKTFATLYQRHEMLTFGNLMRSLARHNIFPASLGADVRQLKEERDYLAHHFFRANDLNFMTVGGCQLMIEQLKERQGRFREIDLHVTEVQDQVFQRVLGIDADTFEQAVATTMNEMEDEARARFAPSVPPQPDR